MEITINGKIPGNKANIIYLPFNKISNIIYMVNYNLLLNILNHMTVILLRIFSNKL